MKSPIYIALAVILAGCVSTTPPKRPAATTMIAHRGESLEAPENTMPAFSLAVTRGFGFECDVRLSKDGRLVILHDADLSRVSGGANTNRCEDLTWDELAKVDVGNWGKWSGSQFAGTRLALLEEVLELARGGREIYIEIKAGPQIVPVLKAAVSANESATPANVLFESFNVETCKAIKELMPDYRVYLLSGGTVKTGDAEEAIPVETLLETLANCGADGINIRYPPQSVSADKVKALKAAGYSVHAWTLDTLDETTQAFAAGVDTVTSNQVKAILDAYAQFYRPVRREAVDVSQDSMFQMMH